MSGQYWTREERTTLRLKVHNCPAPSQARIHVDEARRILATVDAQESRLRELASLVLQHHDENSHPGNCALVPLAEEVKSFLATLAKE